MLVDDAVIRLHHLTGRGHCQGRLADIWLKAELLGALERRLDILNSDEEQDGILAALKRPDGQSRASPRSPPAPEQVAMALDNMGAFGGQQDRRLLRMVGSSGGTRTSVMVRIISSPRLDPWES
jgi:hypothetical protein